MYIYSANFAARILIIVDTVKKKRSLIETRENCVPGIRYLQCNIVY